MATAAAVAGDDGGAMLRHARMGALAARAVAALAPAPRADPAALRVRTGLPL